jgi:hypothetical protein
MDFPQVILIVPSHVPNRWSCYPCGREYQGQTSPLYLVPVQRPDLSPVSGTCIEARPLPCTWYLYRGQASPLYQHHGTCIEGGLAILVVENTLARPLSVDPAALVQNRRIFTALKKIS